MNLNLFTYFYIIILLFQFIIRSYFINSKVVKEASAQTNFLERTAHIIAGTAMFFPLLYVFTPLLEIANYNTHIAFQYSGILLGIFAIFILLLAHKQLGNNWRPYTQASAKQKLISDGIYSYIRHPMYSAHLLWSVSILLLIPNLLAGTFYLLTIILLFLFKVPEEEKLLMEQYGKLYSHYRKMTGAFIPKLKSQKRID